MEDLVRVPDPDFWRGRRVLITGHTGFKGAWLALWLARLGADVRALALLPDSSPSLFDLARVSEACESIMQDLRDPAGLAASVADFRPQIVLHLAAQALVRASLEDPSGTFATNVLGTVNLLDALRGSEGLQAILIVTTDKVYANNGSGRPMRESDRLGGHDPYSASKAACELAVHAFAESFYAEKGIRLATARGGNVIGGGDFARDRITPDCLRAVLADCPVVLRHPRATRPWQHVLDCLCGYLLFAEVLVRDPQLAPQALNFGPKPGNDITVEEFAGLILAALEGSRGIELDEPDRSVEAQRLSLDTTLAQTALGWRDRLVGREAIEATTTWYRRWRGGEDMRDVTISQIERYQNGAGNQV